MAKSQETFGKKEVRNRKEKKRKEKEQRRAQRKSEGKKASFNDMIAYVDEFGVISSTPPDPNRKTEVDPESIELTIRHNSPEEDTDPIKKGVITFFNNSKGFGFIRDNNSGQRIFFHVNNLLEPVAENDTVSYEITRGFKGPSAINVKLFKE
ncbi:MAG: cold shock domain-containing protein [Bacteroidales bacterium]|jgi:cold shock CspA family protein|nr:cold shock domain-containing protein [Bacteroidales bacterium]